MPGRRRPWGHSGKRRAHVSHRSDGRDEVPPGPKLLRLEWVGSSVFWWQRCFPGAPFTVTVHVLR